MLSRKIEEFLSQYKDIIMEEHWARLVNVLILVTNVERVGMCTSTHGTHIRNCSWSNDNCTVGPDTCSCYSYDRKCIEIENLMSKYVLLEKRIKQKT